jgi:hypothetical protein
VADLAVERSKDGHFSWVTESTQFTGRNDYRERDKEGAGKREVDSQGFCSSPEKQIPAIWVPSPGQIECC